MTEEMKTQLWKHIDLCETRKNHGERFYNIAWFSLTMFGLFCAFFAFYFVLAYSLKLQVGILFFSICLFFVSVLSGFLSIFFNRLAAQESLSWAYRYIHSNGQLQASSEEFATPTERKFSIAAGVSNIVTAFFSCGGFLLFIVFLLTTYHASSL